MKVGGGQSDVDRVRDATDLVQLIGEHVALRPKGREHVGLCPFHDDRTPSLAVVTHKGNAFYKCHACGAGGDAFDFVRNYHKLEFPEALRYLAERSGITLQPRQPRDASSTGDASAPSSSELKDANALAAAFFRKVLQASPAGQRGREICTERGINEEMVEAFGLGMAPDGWDGLLTVIRKRHMREATFAAAGLLKQRSNGDGFYDAFRNRLIFPICNELGQPIAFGGRKINSEDEPKYLNSAESAVFHKSRTLYGLHLAKRTIIDARQAIITEGYTDVIACHQAGVCNVVGTLGTALTRQHAKLLSRLCDTVVLLFDGDEAGQRAADRALEAFFHEPVDVKICVLPDGLDPDDLLKRDGADALRSLVAAAEDALEYKIKRFRGSLDPSLGLSARQKRLEQFLRELAELGFGSMQGVRRRLVTTQLADLLGVTTGDIEQAMPRVRRAGGEPEPNVPAAIDQPLSLDDAVAPARRRAEHEVLAIVLYEPEVAVQALPGHDATFADLLRIDHFADAAARHIAAALFDRIERGDGFAVQQLIGDVEHAQVKSAITSLYLEGRRLCDGEAGSPVQQLAGAVQALLSHIDREQYRHRLAAFRQSKPPAEQALDAVQELLEQRRRQGLIAAAISSGERT